jgi:hypothetical protein
LLFHWVFLVGCAKIALLVLSSALIGGRLEERFETSCV